MCESAWRPVEGEAARREGVNIAKEIVDAVMERFHGIYLITPFMRYEMTVELTHYITEKVKNGAGRKTTG